MSAEELLQVAECALDERRAAVRNHPTLNGIDFVEYFEQRTPAPPQFWLVATFLKDASALIGQTSLFAISGGTRVVGIEVLDVTAGDAANQLKVFVSACGDFSFYRLTIDSNTLDPQLAVVDFSFKASCPSDLDCRSETECAPQPLDEPALDYLAKDYASFRRLLLDFAAQRNPSWIERNPAPAGIALVELLAYAGDRLSYFQDAVATEAYLDTCRQRVSAKRHATLIDYRMHDGRNAVTHVQLDVTSTGVVPRGTQLLTRITRPLLGKVATPGVVIDAADLSYDADPALRSATIFETTAGARVSRENGTLVLHAWGDEECCLPIGSTSVFVYAVSGTTAIRPSLSAGDYLLLEEVKGPATGLAADANPAHRQVVRITSVLDDASVIDPLVQSALGAGGALQPVTAAMETPLPLAKLTWSAEEALTFPLCLSVRHPETGLVTGVSLARGNVIPCDHGRTIDEELPLPEPSGGREELLELALPRAPLTFQAPLPDPGEVSPFSADRFELDVDVRATVPAIALELDFATGETESWFAVRDLLDDNSFGQHFVVDIGNAGEATLRFGDDEYGRRPDNITAIRATYRVGNGAEGNVGRESLVHIVTTAVAVVDVYQPIGATGGVAMQTIEEVRQLAPAAFRAEQHRAVTAIDYETAALKVSGVSAAKCVFRWTGSWTTVFVAIHPASSDDLISLPNGRTALRETLANAVLAQLERFRLAGYDLEIRPAQYVPLSLEVRICVLRGYDRGVVLQAVSRVLSNRRFVDGSVGFFHASRVRFGQPVYLSQLYAAVQSVTGVESAEITVFQRYWSTAAGELDSGSIILGDDEIARLDNDPNFAENGVLKLTAVGGAA